MENLITKIKETFLDITEIKEVYSYPVQGSPKKYPAIIFYPLSMENSFDSSTENFKIYNFKVFLNINVSGTTTSDVYTTILPKIHDKVVSVIDEKWNMGTVDGHRVWGRLSTSDLTLTQENNGNIASAEMTLQVKLLTNN